MAAERLLASRAAGALQSGGVQGRSARFRGVAKKVWVRLWAAAAVGSSSRARAVSRSAYARSDLLERRRRLMDEWAVDLDGSQDRQ